MQIVHLSAQPPQPKVKRIPCYKDPVWLANARIRADQHWREYHRKQEEKVTPKPQI